MEWRKLDRIRKQLRRESLADKFIALVDVYAQIVDGGGKGEGVLGSGVECGHQVTSSHCSVETKYDSVGGRAVASHACSRYFIACRLAERP